GPQVLDQLEVLAEPEAAGAEQILGGLGGVDDHPVGGHQEVDRHDREDRGDQDGGGRLPAGGPCPGTAVVLHGRRRLPGSASPGRLRSAGGGCGVGGAHRRFSIHELKPSATADRAKAETAMITACAAASPMSLYWKA